MWFILPILLVSCFLLLWFCYTRKCDVVETHETNARIIGILVVCTLLCVWLIIYGLALLADNIASGNFWVLVLCVPFMLPLILVLYSYFNVEHSFRRRYHLQQWCFTKAEDTEWPGLVRRLSTKLGLSNSPVVAMMPSKWCSPVVFGRSQQRAILALPSDFREMVESATGHESEIADGLTEFILLHELAHIRNRDVAFACWLEGYLRAFRYIAIVLIMSLLLEGALLPSNAMARLTLLLLIVCYSTLLLLANSFRQFRELLADARASLCMNKYLLSRILETRKDCNVSPFESAAIMCTVSRDLGDATILPVKQNLMRTIIDALVRIFCAAEIFMERAAHVISQGPIQKLKSRVGALKTEKYVGLQSTLPTVSAAFWNGFVGGLAFLLSLLLTISSKLYADDIVSRWPFDRTTEIAAAAVGWAALFYVSYVYSLPLRNSTTIAMQTSSYLKGLVFRYFVGALAGVLLFVMLYFTLPTARFQPLQYVGALGFPLSFYSMAFMLSCVFSSILRFEDHIAALYRQKEALIRLMFLPGGLATLGVFVALGVWVGWLVTAVGIAVGLPVSLLLDIAFPLQGHPVDRWVRLDLPILGKLWGKKSFERHTFWIMNLFAFIALSVPSGLATLAMKGFLGGSMVSRLGLSRTQMFYPALLIVLAAFFLAYYLVVKSETRRSGKTLRIGYLLGESVRILGSRLTPSDREKIRQVVSLYESRCGGYSCRIDKPLVEMDATWSALACLSALGLEPVRRVEHIRWILRCENRAGGFGDLPGLSSRLSATYYALNSLSTLGSLETVDSEIHAAWIAKWQIQEGGFHGPYSGWELLTDTYFAIGSLQLLNSMGVVDRKRCAMWALRDWRTGSPTHERTYYLAKVLGWLGYLSEELTEEIDGKYLRPYTPVIAQLRIEKHPGPIFYYLSCADVVKGLHYIEQEMGEFANRVAAGFTSFVQHSVTKLIRDGLKGDGAT